MRTLSARILLGFAALTITFGVITATVVRNMGALEENMVVLSRGVPLALAVKDLDRKQDDLYAYITERFFEETNPTTAHLRLTAFIGKRDRALTHATHIVDDLDKEVPERLSKMRTQLANLQTSIDANLPLYEQVLAALPVGDPATLDAKHRASIGHLQRARNREFLHGTQTKNLELDKYINTRTTNLVANGALVRSRTIYLGSVALVLGLLTTIWVVIMLRPLRRLRVAARRVAAGDYASRIPDDGPTEVADLAREFNSMSLAVEERERELVRSERLAAVGKMAAMITHEVRNPLSSIGLNTELLEEELAGSPNEAEARGLCRSINREIDRLTAITEEYLAFARLPTPKIAPEPVNAMIEALATFVRQDLAQKKVELVTELEGDPIALVDAAQLRQCLINLVRNASEAVAAKGGGRITLRTSMGAERVTIAVEDDGIGIPPDVLPRLFDPFFSTKEGGSGLGLALTKQIVKDHGGDLEVTSTVGRGTTFTVSVPVGTARDAG